MGEKLLSKNTKYILHYSNDFLCCWGLLFLALLAAVAIEISIPVGALTTTLGLGIGKGIITAIK